MPVPSYKTFIEPILRFLASHQGSVAADDAREAAAQALNLTDKDRGEQLTSGKLTYRDRTGWAFDRLKRAGFATAPGPGQWQLTTNGKKFADSNPTLTHAQIAILAAAASTPPNRGLTRVPDPPKGSIAPAGDRRAYRLPPRPIASGGQAEVFEAVRKADGRVVVLKRVLGPSKEPRMRREIEIQSSLEHRNIMPILDWEIERFRWYVMPRGTRVMSALARPVADGVLCEVLRSVLAALEAGNAAGHPHRDVKPHNIIELSDETGQLRWVLADWGLARRPLGETTAALTKSGHALGTDGYAPPEAYTDPHNVGEVGDIYSLGQVIAWARGVDPIPNVSSNVPGIWGRLVEPMTKLQMIERPQSVADVRRILTSICSGLKSSQDA